MKLSIKIFTIILITSLLLLFSNHASLLAADPYVQQRKEMIEHDIKGRGVKDKRVLEVMEKVPRHLFVKKSLRDRAYADHPLPIAEGQTISQPYIVALMTEALQLKPTDKVLEIVTGSGYQAAVLAEIVKKVYTIEIRKPRHGKKEA
jgi:protein-L-isoaspartate(D-aspartate) O-methyltransferase